jgi:hypothetical protein
MVERASTVYGVAFVDVNGQLIAVADVARKSLKTDAFPLLSFSTTEKLRVGLERREDVGTRREREGS